MAYSFNEQYIDDLRELHSLICQWVTNEMRVTINVNNYL